jgi:hypothetical protein
MQALSELAEGQVQWQTEAPLPDVYQQVFCCSHLMCTAAYTKLHNQSTSERFLVISVYACVVVSIQ